MDLVKNLVQYHDLAMMSDRTMPAGVSSQENIPIHCWFLNTIFAINFADGIFFDEVKWLNSGQHLAKFWHEIVHF